MKLFHITALSSLLIPGIVGQHDGLAVSTKQGVVKGTFVAPNVRQFLGIPYASAKRWGPPGLPPKRASALSATKFSNSCIQSLTPSNAGFLEVAGGLGLNVPSGEDCLTANIWAPSLSRKQGTAVMIWVYGGSFQFGTSNFPIFIGENFVRDHDDITLVSFNYRTNIFGQPNAPQLVNAKNSQNFGLLDVAAAIQWVHANIENFGGDPNRIIIFGESAGSTATDAYAFSHPTDTIVKGIIQESGTLALITNGDLGTATANATTWNTVASAVGCGSSATPSQLACMEAVDATVLESAVINTGVTFKIVEDGITSFSASAVESMAAAGRFLKVPLLGGSCLNEGDIFVVVQELLTTGVAAPLPVTFAASDRLTEGTFTCPAGSTAKQRLAAGVNTWRYQYQAIFPDISTRPDLRAYHTSELPIVFGTYNSSTAKVGPTSNEIALSKYVQSAWVAFARDPNRGLVNFGWPLYNPDTKSLAQLGNAANATGVVFTEGAIVDAQCT